MVTQDPRSGDDFDGGPRRTSPERHTEPIPMYTPSGYDSPAYEGAVQLDDVELASLGADPVSPAVDQRDIITTRDPSPLARRYLFPTEKFRGEWRRHWIHLVRVLGLGVLATFVLGYLAGMFVRQSAGSALTLLVLVWLGIIGWVLWDVVEWYFDKFILTNKRVMLIQGIVTRKVAMMPLGRVTDMKYTQSALGRVLGYGKFEIESAGQDQALRNVPNLPNPTDVYLQVVEEMYEPEASEARRRPATMPEDDGT